MCSEALVKTDKRVRDLCHITEKYRRAAHNNCNLNYRIPTFLPVFLHNNCHYDTHLFVKELSKTPVKITAIPNLDQNYISFTKQIYTHEMGLNTNIRFLDTYKFMTSPRSSLVSSISSFPILSRQFRTETDLGKDISLLTKKDIYPHDYMDSFERFQETRLPPQKRFYNKLGRCHIPGEEYETAKQVWKEFEIKKIGEYHDLY